eukprot:Skav233010  [mRNA]  locus=scaffold909:65816:66403:+ [translate_table: standard]
MSFLARQQLEQIKLLTKDDLEWNPIMAVPGLLVCLLSMLSALKELLMAMRPMSAAELPLLTTLVTELSTAVTVVIGACAMQDYTALQAASPDPTEDWQLAQQTVDLDYELHKLPRIAATFMLESLTPKAYKCDQLVEACVELCQKYLWQAQSEPFTKIRDAIAKIRPIVVDVQSRMSFAPHGPGPMILPTAGSQD